MYPESISRPNLPSPAFKITGRTRENQSFEVGIFCLVTSLRSQEIFNLQHMMVHEESQHCYCYKMAIKCFFTQYSPTDFQLSPVVIAAVVLSMEMSPIDRNNHLASDHPGFANFSHNFIYQSQSPTLHAPPADSLQIVILV